MQEMTPAGAHVRTIGTGAIPDGIIGIAAKADVVIVGTTCRLLMFDFTSGGLIRSFGEEGAAEGNLRNVLGLRFTPDGGHILVAEFDNDRLSLFTLGGAFVRWIGVNSLTSPVDVDFAPSGDILVADRFAHRVSVFTPDGSTLLRSFGSEGGEPGQFQLPCTLAVHGQTLYVLDYTGGRVQVFT